MDLRLDGWTKETAPLDDAQFIRLFISDLAHTIGMTIINGPTVASFKEFSGDPQAGLSGFAIIAESHIAIHTWPVEKYVMVDIVSCRDFNDTLAKDFIKVRLQITRVKMGAVLRSRSGPEGISDGYSSD